MNFDYNNPVDQLAAIELMQPVYSFLYDTFVDDKGAVEEEDIAWDSRVGDVPMAPFVHEDVGGVPIARANFTTHKLGFPTIAPEMLVKSIDIKTRAFDEVFFGGMTPAERANKLIGEDIQTLRLSIQKRREWMVAQMLLKGLLEIFKHTSLGGVTVADKTVDYNFQNHFVASTKWNQSGHDILGDIDRCEELVRKNLGAPEVIVCGSDVKYALFASESYKKVLDNRNLEAGHLMLKYTAIPGVQFLGHTASGLEVYTYNREFEDGKGGMLPFIPKGKFIMGSKKMLKGYHAPVTIIDKDGPEGKFVTYVKKEVPERFADKNGNVMKQRVTSRPILVPKNVGGWVVGEVL